MHSFLAPRIIAFGSSLILTFTAFAIIARPDFFHLKLKTAVIALLTLAIAQGIVQSIFFLNVLSGKRPRWNLVVFASTVSLVLIIVVFSIWIMNHLNYNMMPH